jgi:hypothetical protein
MDVQSTSNHTPKQFLHQALHLGIQQEVDCFLVQQLIISKQIKNPVCKACSIYDLEKLPPCLGAKICSVFNGRKETGERFESNARNR